VTAALEGHCDRGRRLIRAGNLIIGHGEFQTWRHELRRWRACSEATVCAEFEPEAIDEFVRISTEATGSEWKDSLKSDLRALHNAIELLGLLRSTLVATRGPPWRRRGPGRAP
jgi:hypothetical protein